MKKTPEQIKKGKEKQRASWAHNGLRNSLSMSANLMRRIVQAKTTTPQAKALALQFHEELKLLQEAMNTRVDQ